MLRLDDANRGNIDKIKNAMIDGTNGQKFLCTM